jgi:hypothetical protein
MVDSIHPLPHHRVRAAPTARGRVLVRKRDYDAWIAHYRADAPAASAPGDVSWIRRGLRVEK